MRKITENAVNRFASNDTVNLGNTLVFSGITKRTMVLFGNVIAKLDHGRLYISACGHYTATTKERLNGLCFHYLGYSPIRQRKGVWFFDETPFSQLEGADGFFQVWPIKDES